MTKPLGKFLSFTLLKTFLIGSVITIVTFKIMDMRESYGFEEKQADFIETVALIFWILTLTFSALTVYLNLRRSIRAIPLFSFLSFFLMPTLVAIGVFASGDKNDKWISFYITTIIFLLTHAFFFIKFLRQNRIGWKIPEI